MKNLARLLLGLLIVFLLTTLAAVYFRPAEVGESLTRAMLGIKGMTHHQVIQDGISYSFFERHPEAPKTLVLVHGLGDHAGSWWQTLDKLEDFHVIALDLPGHGDSGPATGEITIPMFERALEIVDSRRGDKPLTLLGNSMGGYVILRYALDHPGKVQHLVLLNAAGMPMEISRDVFLPQSRQATAATILKVLGPEEKQPPGFILDDIQRSMNAGPIPRLWNAITTAGPLTHELPNVAVRTDVVWGTQDGLIPVEQGRAMAKLIPNARFHPIEHCAHSPQITCPELFLPVLTGILSAPPHTDEHPSEKPPNAP